MSNTETRCPRPGRQQVPLQHPGILPLLPPSRLLLHPPECLSMMRPITTSSGEGMYLQRSRTQVASTQGKQYNRAGQTTELTVHRVPATGRAGACSPITPRHPQRRRLSYSPPLPRLHPQLAVPRLLQHPCLHCNQFLAVLLHPAADAHNACLWQCHQHISGAHTLHQAATRTAVSAERGGRVLRQRWQAAAGRWRQRQESGNGAAGRACMPSIGSTEC